MAVKTNKIVRKLTRKLTEQAKKRKFKKPYTREEIDEVAVNLAEAKTGKLHKSNDQRSPKITSKKAAVAKGLNIADSKKKK